MIAKRGSRSPRRIAGHSLLTTLSAYAVQEVAAHTLANGRGKAEGGMPCVDVGIQFHDDDCASLFIMLPGDNGKKPQHHSIESTCDSEDDAADFIMLDEMTAFESGDVQGADRDTPSLRRLRARKSKSRSPERWKQGSLAAPLALRVGGSPRVVNVPRLGCVPAGSFCNGLVFQAARVCPAAGTLLLSDSVSCHIIRSEEAVSGLTNFTRPSRTHAAADQEVGPLPYLSTHFCHSLPSSRHSQPVADGRLVEDDLRMRRVALQLLAERADGDAEIFGLPFLRRSPGGAQQVRMREDPAADAWRARRARHIPWASGGPSRRLLTPRG